MVNEEILGGLKLALSKGESLKKAMMTFFNAGYKREEIEEAAKVLQTQGIKKEIPQEKPIQKESPKKVSSYEESTSPKGKIMIILLILFIILLVGGLIAVFLFRQEIIDFFNKVS